MSIEQTVARFIEILTLTHRPASLPSSLGTYQPQLECLNQLSINEAWKGKFSRDDDDLCIQPQPGNTENPKDGGDSAHRAGYLAFCGSQLDQANLARFMLESGLMVRHPKQAPWNNPWNATRDQLIGYLSGCWRAQRFELSRALYLTHEERGFTCQSRESDWPGTTKPGGVGDILAPEHLMYFKVCTGDFGAINDLAGQLNLYISIQFLSNAENVEINQSLLMSIVCGQLDIFTKAHPTYREQLRKYWGKTDAFRYQPCIAETMIQVVDRELARYKDRNLVDLLLPQNLLEELRSIDVISALKNLQALNPLWYAEIEARLMVALMKDLVAYIDTAWRTLQTLTQLELELYYIVVRTTRWAAKELESVVTQKLGTAAPLIAPFLRAAGLVLSLLGGGEDNEEAKAFRSEVRRDLHELLANSNETLNKLDTLTLDIANLRADFPVFLSDAFRSEAFGALKGRIAAGMIILDDYMHIANEADERSIRNIVIDCNSVALRAEEFGPSALPHLTHAFSFVAHCLEVIGDTSELHITRGYYANIAEKLYFAKLGLHEKIVTMRQDQAAVEREFSELCGIQQTATRNVQKYRWTTVNAELVVIEAIPSYDTFREFVLASGDITNAASIVVEAIDANKAQAVATKRSPCYQEIVSPFNGGVDHIDEAFCYPDGRGVPKARAIALTHLTLMQTCAQRWQAVVSARKQTEAIAVSSRATFGF